MKHSKTITDTYSNDYEGAQPYQKSLSEIAKSLQHTMDGNGRTKLGDVFTNTQLDLGFGTNDPVMQSIYPQARSLTWNLQRIEAVMRADPFFTRALEYRASKPLMKGIDISTDKIEAERLQEFQEHIRLELNPAIKEGLIEADAFGWSALLIMIDGHINARKLATPLRPEEVTQNKFLGLKPLTRWYQINPTQEMITKIGKESEIYDPRLLGTPLYYNVSFDGDKGKMYKVHRSRLIIISRNKLSYIEKKIEHYGGTSLLEQSFESLSQYHSLVSQIHRLLQKSVIPVLKMEELASSAMQTKTAQNLIEKKIDVMRSNLSSNNLFVIGEGDEISFEQANLAGLSEQLADARRQLSSAFNTPPEVLFFEHQEYDENGIEDFIRDRQEFMILPIYRIVLPLAYRSVYGSTIPKYKITFKPLENPTSEQIASARKHNVEAIIMLYEKGVFNKKTVLDTLPDIDSNPSDILRNIDPEFYKYVESLDVTEGYYSDQISLAEALNQGKEQVLSGQQGKLEGGDMNKTKKPTPKVPVAKGGE